MRVGARVVLTESAAALGPFFLFVALPLVSVPGTICSSVSIRCHGHSNRAERASRGFPVRMSLDMFCGRGRERRAGLRPVGDADLVVDAASKVGVGSGIPTMQPCNHLDIFQTQRRSETTPRGEKADFLGYLTTHLHRLGTLL